MNNLGISSRKKFSLLLTVLICPQIIAATEKDTIGLTDLLSRKPGADGSGIRVAQVEAGNSSGGYQARPAAASQPDSKFSFYDGDSVYPVAGSYDAAKQSSHANTVANNFYDLNTGVATDVSEIYVFEAGSFYNGIVRFNSADVGAKVINQSFIFGGAADSSGNIAIQNAYDNYAADRNTLFVNGTNNGSGNPVATPGTMFNGITVGREDAVLASGGATTINGRSKPDMIAPGRFSSYATPYVAGSAAVLIEAANNGEGGVGTATAGADPRTVKALLLNGAVKDFSWVNTSTEPLDRSRGAGLLQIDHSYSILEGGKHSPISSTRESDGGIHVPSSSTAGNIASPIGWNFNTISSSTVSTGLFSSTSHDQVDNYYFNHTSTKDLVATLTWNRQQNQSNINNLDLYLFNAATGTVVESSVSTVDNVEHIYSRDLPAGRYVLQVVKRVTGRVSHPEDYALAFRFSDPAPDAPSALAASAASDTEISLTWTDNSSDETSFEVQRSRVVGRLYETVATLAADTVSYTDSGLAAETRYFYRVKATNAAGDSFYTNVADATTYNEPDGWRFSNFGTTANSGVAANDADPDKDGMTNLTEYALGKDPNSALGADGNVPQASLVEVGGQTYLQITANRTKIRADINYAVEVTSDLVNASWSGASVVVIEDVATTLRVRDSVAIGLNDTRFIRLKVTEQSP